MFENGITISKEIFSSSNKGIFLKKFKLMGVETSCIDNFKWDILGDTKIWCWCELNSLDEAYIQHCTKASFCKKIIMDYENSYRGAYMKMHPMHVSNV